MNLLTKKKKKQFDNINWNLNNIQTEIIRFNIQIVLLKTKIALFIFFTILFYFVWN